MVFACLLLAAYPLSSCAVAQFHEHRHLESERERERKTEKIGGWGERKSSCEMYLFFFLIRVKRHRLNHDDKYGQ